MGQSQDDIPAKMKLHGTIVAIDAGFTNCGVVVYNTGRILHAECISFPARPDEKASLSLLRRSAATFNRLRTIIGRYDASVVVAEIPHGGAKSARAMQAMAVASAVVACAAAASGLPFHPITPNQIKRLIGDGAIEKEEVAAYVKVKFKSALSGFLVQSRKANLEHVYDALGALAVFLENRHA